MLFGFTKRKQKPSKTAPKYTDLRCDSHYYTLPIDVYNMSPVHCECVFCVYEAEISRPDYWKIPRDYEDSRYGDRNGLLRGNIAYGKTGHFVGASMVDTSLIW